MRSIILLIAITLTGCAASSVMDIKTSPAIKTNSTINDNYLNVYENTLSKINSCLGDRWIGNSATYEVKTTLYKTKKEGEISYRMNNMGTIGYYLHFSIKAIDENTTNFTGYAYFKTWKKQLDKATEWANNTSDSCD